MQSQRVVSTAIGSLLLIEGALSLLFIILLGRMAPAIEHILQENVFSEEAVEDMLIELLGDEPEREKAFAEALERARNNITDDRERPVVAAIERNAAMVFGVPGDAGARQALVRELKNLSTINRRIMVTAGDRARRLGTAGAWASAISGLVAIVLTLLLGRRVIVRVVRPLQMIAEVVQAAASGDAYRRCALSQAYGLAELASHVNQLLDYLRPGGPSSGDRSIDRALVLHLLDQRSQPCFAATPSGEVITGNRAALDLLLGDEAPVIRARLAAAVASPEPAPGLRLEEVQGGRFWLVTMDGSSDSAPASPGGS